MAFPVAGYGQGQKRSAVGGGNSGLQLLLSLINQQQGGFDEAKQANESRYQDILELFGNNRARTLGLLDNFGKSLVDDSNRTYDDKRKELLTDLADRGLSGSTARIGVETGVKRERDAALNRIKDMLVQDTTNADLGFTDRAAGVMERRDDPYPENSQSSALIGQLINALAAGGGGGGGGLAGLLGGGASSLRQDPTRALRMQALAAQAQPTQPAFNTNGLSQDEIQRRNNMLGLFLAESPNTGTYVGDKEKAALSQLLASGQSQYNPSQVGAALIDRTPRQPIFYNNGGYGGGGGGYYRPTRDYSGQRQLQRGRSLAATGRRVAMQGGNEVLGNMSLLPTPYGGRTTSVRYDLANAPVKSSAPYTPINGGYGAMLGNGLSMATQSLAAQAQQAQGALDGFAGSFMSPTPGPLGRFGGRPVGYQETPFPQLSNPNHPTMDDYGNIVSYYRTVRGY